MTRDDMPPVPAGKVRLMEYRDIGDQSLMADKTTLASATAAVHFYPTATLAYETRGYVPAGSVLRWQEANWSVLYWLPDGTQHGRRFLEEDKAREFFAALTDPQKVSARRQEDARLEETVYRPAREEAAKREAARIADAKARRRARRAS